MNEVDVPWWLKMIMIKMMMIWELQATTFWSYKRAQNMELQARHRPYWFKVSHPER